MPTNVKQHYVPKLYLKRFADKENKVFYLYNSKNRILRKSINDVCEEKYFYRIDNLKNPNVWEEIYANQIEPKLEKTIDNILKKANLSIITNNIDIMTSQDRYSLSYLMIIQMFRSTKSRNLQKELYKNLIESLRKRYKSYSMGNILDLIENDNNYFKQSSMMASISGEHIKRLVNYFNDGYFVVYKIIGNREFITCDNPVIGINIGFENESNKKNKCIYVFPLSPKLLIMNYRKNLYFDLISKYNNKLINICENKEEDFISYINKHIYCYSDKFVISNSENELKKLINVHNN